MCSACSPSSTARDARSSSSRTSATSRPSPGASSPCATARSSRSTIRARRRQATSRRRSGRRDVARHDPHCHRGRPNPSPPLGVDHARHPDRDHGCRAHLRARRGREGEGAGSDQRARHECARRVARQLDEQLRHPRGLRLGVDVDPPGRRRRGLPGDGARRAVCRTGIYHRGVSTGRFITSADEAKAAPVVVLGPDTVTQLFGGNPNPIGQTVSYNGVSLQVVGVLDSLSSSENASNNDLAVVPLAAYEQRLVGGANRNSDSSIYVKARSSERLSAAYQETNALLLNTHHVTNPRNADFSIATQQSILEAATSVDNTLTVMLAGIAAIALLVGGIGVMNIMLVSVAERTREIGVRKAIGARPGVIRHQFLVEASLLGLAGGVLGLLLGLLGALFIPVFTDSRVDLSFVAMIGALAVAVGVGIAFGVYPASRAARLAPIDALRSE